MTKAILVDPVTHQVTEVNVDGLSDIQKTLECSTITSGGYWNDNAVYCDDEALF